MFFCAGDESGAMRTKTDEKRRAILAAACALFEEAGFERASMSAIAARAGASKATIYGYFATKEKLFATAMTDALHGYAAHFIDQLDAEGPVETVLESFGAAYLRFVLSDQLLSLQRATLSDVSLHRLGPELYALGPMQAWTRVSEFLRRRMESGELRAADPLRAAFDFKGLLESGMFEPALQHVPPLFDIEDAVRNARMVFLSAYGAKSAN